ncbi:YveK family protein [Neobacillus sp. GCM10023253]|uniref:YveK family protein n=1 Tax=Neobacillus sp. GCM10023253 TaxID=3252644 RepID=UPI003618C64E
MEETISIKELLKTLRKRLILILGITFMAVLISGVVSFYFLTPVYQASTQLLVNQSKSVQTPYQYSEVQTNLQLINTYNVIIKSPAILEIVIKDLNLDMTVKQLTQKISVGNEENSQVVNLSVQDPNFEKAANIANKTAEIFKSEIVKIMNVDNVSILTEADISDHPSPIKPRTMLIMAISFAVGLMAGVCIALLLEFFDNTIENEQEIEKLIGVPVLGIIATMDKLNLKDNMNAISSEQNARLRGETIGS